MIYNNIWDYLLSIYLYCIYIGSDNIDDYEEKLLEKCTNISEASLNLGNSINEEYIPPFCI